MDNNQVTRDLFVPLKRNEDKSEQITSPSRTFMQDARLTFFKNKLAVASFIILLIIMAISMIGPFMNEHGLDEQDLNRSKMPPRVPLLEHIPWFGLDGTLSSTIQADTVEEAVENAINRYYQHESYLDFKIIDEGDGTADSAKVKATYYIYQAKGMDEEYFWFGTDTLGRDQWTRLWTGTSVSLFIAFVATFISLVIGVAYGGIAGYFGGKLDDVMMRILEILIGIPSLVVILLMMLFLNPGITSIVIALTITGWTGMARIVRGEVMKIKNEEFVLAAKTLGQSHRKIITKHLLPNISGVIIINLMFTIPDAIFFESFLSFIGLGITPPNASLGTLINDGFENITIYPHMLVFPALFISIIMISFNLIGDGLRDAFDPKMKR